MNKTVAGHHRKSPLRRVPHAQLDDEALFYLRSRGIREADARDLLIRAFAGQVLDALPVPGLADGLAETLDARLLHARGDA